MYEGVLSTPVLFVSISDQTAAVEIRAFFITNTFIGNASLKLAKNQAKFNQNPDTELLLFQNYFLFSVTFSSQE